MPQRHRQRQRHRNRTMKGGFLDDFSNTLSSWGSSISRGASSMWAKTKSSLTGSPSYNSYNSYNSYTPSSSYNQTTSYTPSSTYQSPMNTSTYGGKHTRRRKHRGGGIASNASPVSNIKTAQPHNLVGGKTRRRKTRKH